MFQILSLSGGGYLGLYSATVLALIEERLERPLIESFDLIAGTSVGGIIGLGLAAGRSAADIRDAFLANGEEIFSSARPPNGVLDNAVRLITGIPWARYSTNALEKTIESIVGKNALMSDLSKPTIVTAVNLTKGGPKIFKTGHHPDFVIDWRLPILDVALATSAAPTYFPIHKIGNELYADGGMFANSPDLIAVHEAEHFLGVDRKDISVLSIGTTSTTFAFSNAGGRNFGSFGWMKDERLPSVMIGSQQALTDDMMNHMLGKRYLRIDRAQSITQKKQLSLDSASADAKDDLQAMAASSYAEFSKNANLSAMLTHRAPAFQFINAR